MGSDATAARALAHRARRFHRSTGEWSDGPTQWYTVNAWRTLGEHCAASLHRGDPVVVHGRLTQSSWVNNDGIEITSMEVDALFVGHDLNRGRTTFTKPVRGDQREPEAAEPTQLSQPTPTVEATTGWVA